jgi:hypothetical protein
MFNIEPNLRFYELICTKLELEFININPYSTKPLVAWDQILNFDIYTLIVKSKLAEWFLAQVS